jgi:hypothetical protein
MCTWRAVQYGTIAPSLLQVSGLGATYFAHLRGCGVRARGPQQQLVPRRGRAGALVSSTHLLDDRRPLASHPMHTAVAAAGAYPLEGS